MPRSLKLLLVGVVAGSAIALVAATLVFGAYGAIALPPPEGQVATPGAILLGMAFWTVLTVISSALPVQMPRGTQQAVSFAPILAATFLGGPAVGGWVAAIGTTELRELRGRVPWYGTLANHAAAVAPAIGAGIAYEAVLAVGGRSPESVSIFIAAMVGGAVYYGLNEIITSAFVALRTGRSFPIVVVDGWRSSAVNNLALVPLAWLMALVFELTWWATLLFAVPLYITRIGYQRFIEMRLMFTQTITALAEAVDKRDPFTARHSQNVKSIAVEIGRAMRLSDADLEALEWGGLLHDVGKIGVPDAVLLKAERLNKDERMVMNSHPVLGAEIISPVERLAPELPIIRHHHEWFNGSGYPDRLIGDEIPMLARILHVADAFEAMTAARPYRMTPLTAEQALSELRKFAGIQFDPVIVDAFVKTHYVHDVPDAGRHMQLQPIPLISQAAANMVGAPRDTSAPVEQA
jgi:putative nucleotidyltransferase with HDIG domain